MDRLLARLLKAVAGGKKKVMMVAGVAGKGSGHHLVKKVMAKFDVFVTATFSVSFCEFINLTFFLLYRSCRNL
jgi:hypothetical protein